MRLHDIDPEIERSRLVHAVKNAIHSTHYKTARELWEQILECHRAYRKYECLGGHEVALTFSCGFQLCPTCMPSRLRTDFRRHQDKLPERVALFVVQLPDGVRERKASCGWFRSWRRKTGLDAGFYGARLGINQPDILLVVPADGAVAALSSDPHVACIAENVSLDEGVDWYVDMFREQISSWRTPDEMLALLSAVKGCRRFQGFGKYYAKKEPANKAHAEHLLTGEERKLHRASGGSARGGSKAPPCPVCGLKLRFVGIAPSAEGMHWDKQYGCYFWGTGPPTLAAERAS